MTGEPRQRMQRVTMPPRNVPADRIFTETIRAQSSAIRRVDEAAAALRTLADLLADGPDSDFAGDLTWHVHELEGLAVKLRRAP
jgi:hypothetical protein